VAGLIEDREVIEVSWSARRDVTRPIATEQRSWTAGRRAHTRVHVMRVNVYKTRMWAGAQRDGRPAEYRWRPLFIAAKFG